MIYKFDCPFGGDDDCPNELSVEVDEGIVGDVEGCHHVDKMTVGMHRIIDDILDDIYQRKYDDAMEARVDALRDRDV